MRCCNSASVQGYHVQASAALKDKAEFPRSHQRLHAGNSVQIDWLVFTAVASVSGSGVNPTGADGANRNVATPAQLKSATLSSFQVVPGLCSSGVRDDPTVAQWKLAHPAQFSLAASTTRHRRAVGRDAIVSRTSHRGIDEKMFKFLTADFTDFDA